LNEWNFMGKGKNLESASALCQNYEWTNPEAQLSSSTSSIANRFSQPPSALLTFQRNGTQEANGPSPSIPNLSIFDIDNEETPTQELKAHRPTTKQSKDKDDAVPEWILDAPESSNEIYRRSNSPISSPHPISSPPTATDASQLVTPPSSPMANVTVDVKELNQVTTTWSDSDIGHRRGGWCN
jgi:hypothetical protein